MGHLAYTDDQTLKAVTGSASELPESYAKLFGAGSIPSDDADDYPTRQQLQVEMSTTRARLLKWTLELNGSNASTPVPEPLRPFAPDWISLPFTICSHELYHLDQIGTVRAHLKTGYVHA